MDIEALQRKLAGFSADRDWDQFRSPKNLAMALAAEAKLRIDAEKYPAALARGNAIKGDRPD